MRKEPVVKSAHPLGRIVERVMVANTPADARAMAEDTGLLFVVVNENVPPPPRSSSGENPVDGG